MKCVTKGVKKIIKNKTKTKNAVIVLLISNSIMNLQGPLAKQITAEILNHVNNLCITRLGYLSVTIFLLYL